MAKDDYFVIVYKILQYLYSCMKAGRMPDPEDLQPGGQLYNIPESYWIQIMTELIDRGYVKGIYEVKRIGRGNCVMITPEAAITMTGMEFLQDNSRMKKAAEFTGEAFESLLGAMISQLPLILSTIMQ